MLDFERTRKPTLDLPLTAMIDVVFILIIFFMLTTSFTRLESMELMLPTVTPLSSKKILNSTMAHIYLRGNGSIAYGDRPMGKDELHMTLKSIFQNAPDQRTVVLVDQAVSLQTLVNIMDVVYLAGGKNVFVKEWQPQTISETGVAQ